MICKLEAINPKIEDCEVVKPMSGTVESSVDVAKTHTVSAAKFRVRITAEGPNVASYVSREVCSLYETRTRLSRLFCYEIARCVCAVFTLHYR